MPNGLGFQQVSLVLYMKAIITTTYIDIMEDLLLKYYTGKTNDDETAIVEEWINESDENKKMAQNIFSLYLASGMSDVAHCVNVDLALENTNKKINRQNKSNSRLRYIFRSVRNVAAIMALPLLLGCSYLFFHNRDMKVAEMIEVRTNPGMTTSVILPDSTVVILNSSSRLSYPSRFSKTREVKLVGEAFFSVKKDKKRQFIVNTLSETAIIVHGTEFDVEAYEDDNQVSTTLVSGKVAFSCVSQGRRGSVMMQPGQKVIYDSERKRVSLEKANIDVETSWKDGHLIFVDTPFEDILKALSKRYNVRFVVKNKNLMQYSFTGRFVSQRLERVLEIFSVSSKIRFQFMANANTDEEKQIIEVY